MNVLRFKFANEDEAVAFFSEKFGVDEEGKPILNSADHSVTMIGKVIVSDEEGKPVVISDSYHANLVTREPSNITKHVIDPVTPMFLIQGE